jgi:hypothetical protein
MIKLNENFVLKIIIIINNESFVMQFVESCHTFGLDIC